jgi:hypothetical protein
MAALSMPVSMEIGIFASLQNMRVKNLILVEETRGRSG